MVAYQVTARANADPDVPVCRWNGQAANAREMGCFRDALAVQVLVGEPAPVAQPPDARVTIGGEEEAFRGGRPQRLGLWLKVSRVSPRGAWSCL
jgi:hypothetical protein